jgi:hypothetical protein
MRGAELRMPDPESFFGVRKMQERQAQDSAPQAVIQQLASSCAGVGKVEYKITNAPGHVIGGAGIARRGGGGPRGAVAGKETCVKRRLDPYAPLDASKRGFNLFARESLLEGSIVTKI